MSPICGEAPTEAMYMKICVVGDVLDVITYATFQNEIFRGYNFTGGRVFHFSYWFWIGLTTVQRYCAACDNVFCCWQERVDFIYDFIHSKKRNRLTEDGARDLVYVHSNLLLNIQAVNYVETKVEWEQWAVADSDSE